MRRDDEQLKSIVETSPIGVIIIDDDGVQRWVNRRAGVMLGATAAELTGMAQTLRHPDGYGTVLRTNPKPSARVTDMDLFATWAAATFPERVQWRNTFQVLDDDDLAEAARDHADAWAAEDDHAARETAFAIASLVKPTRTPLVPSGLLDEAVESGRVALDGDAAVDVETGERLAGVAVSCAAPATQVRVDSKHRKTLTAQLPGGDG